MSLIGVHAAVSNDPPEHSVHPAHTVLEVGVHAAAMYCVGAHVVHGWQICPVPVSPGPQVQTTVPPTSAHNAPTLQPPLFTAHVDDD